MNADDRKRHRIRRRVEVRLRWRVSFYSGSWLMMMMIFLTAFLFTSSLLPLGREEILLRGVEAADDRRHSSNRGRQLKEADGEQRLRGESKQVQAQAKDPNSILTLNQLLAKAGKRGLGGGIPGFFAGIAQVVSLMWLRTIINYQCRYGASFREAFVTLKKEGGIARFYRGLWFALIQAPMTRFVSTASNDGVEALLAGLQFTKDWGPGRTTVVASLVVGFWRIVLMPIDTCKTVLQIDSTEGFRNLMRRVKAGKIGVLYQGSFAMAASAIMGHYPWFFTFNFLSKNDFVNNLISSQLLRNAGIGVVSSFVSDTLINSIRVVKTTKQAMGSKHSVGYLDTVRMILAADGWKGLFGRGLRARIYANALQSLVFTIIWRGLADHWRQKSEGRDLSETDNESGAKQ